MSIILHMSCRNIDFSKRGTAPLKGGLDIWKCTLHSFKGHGLDIVPAKTHCIARKEDYSYSQGYVCFEYCICWQVQYGDVVIMLKSSSIFCRNCVLLKGQCSSIYLR